MKNRSLYAVLTRFGIVAAVLTALLVIAPAAAQEADMGPCDEKGTTCSIDENAEDLVIATYSASDPEGQGITWSVEGVDNTSFSIEGGVLAFKSAPDYEMPGDKPHDADDGGSIIPDDEGVDNEYLVTVVATEMLTEGQKPPAESKSLPVTVMVKNVEEPGMITLDRLQTRVGAAGDGVTATLTDPDGPAGTATEIAVTSWEWSIPKVNRPVLDDDDHWTPAGDDTNDHTEEGYTPVAGDAGAYLRVKAMYADGEGTGKTTYAKSAYPALAARTGDPIPENTLPAFDADALPFSLMVPESAAVGTVVGTVRATDTDSGDTVSHQLTATGASDGKFKIDLATGEITVAAGLNHEDGTLTDGEYSVIVTGYDPLNAATSPTATVTITATDVNEDPGVGDSSTTAVSSTMENHAVEDDTENNVDALVLGTFARPT